MITLLTYPAMFGEFSASPFCTKAAYLLALSGQEWQREDTLDPRKMRYGKLPVIRVPEGLIADSDAIRAHLEVQGASFDDGLSVMDKATARAFIRMAEEHLYFNLVLDRWQDDAVWPMVRDAYFVEIPKPLRGLITRKLRRNLLAGMHAQGLGRFSAEDRLARVDLDLQAIATRLWQGKYLFGDTPSAADCSVAAMLGAMRATPVKTHLSERVSTDALLCEYADRMAATLPSAGSV